MPDGADGFKLQDTRSSAQGRGHPVGTGLAGLVEPNLSTEAARLRALSLRHQLNPQTRLINARAPGVLTTLFQQLDRLR
jgi:hypothetical protein